MATCPRCRKTFADDVARCPDDDAALLPDVAFANAAKRLEAGSAVGDYQVLELLGEGSYGSVYSAEHPVIGKRVAAKVLNSALSTDPETVSRFVAEAKALVAIDSPYIIDVLSFGSLDDGRAYYLMELLDGVTLDHELERQPEGLDPAVALRILICVADALEDAHQAGIIHRDLKPENIFVARDRSDAPLPKLLDFGVAKLAERHQRTHKTQTGAIVGTPAYMAPEQCLSLDTDHRIDVYALGVIAFELLTGNVPYDAHSFVALANMHTSDPIPAPSEHNPALGTHFDAAIAALMAKDIADRPASAAEARVMLLEAAEASGLTLEIPSAFHARSSNRGSTERPGNDEVRAARAAALGSANTVIMPSEPPEARPARGAMLDTVAAATNTTEVLATERPSSSSRVAWAIAVAAVVGLVGFIAYDRFDSSGPATAPAAGAPTDLPVAATHTPPMPTSSTSAATTSATTASATTAPAKVTITLESAVPGARAELDGRALDGLTVELPRSDRSVTLVVTAPGHASKNVEVVPNQNRRQRVVLTPRATKSPTTVPPRTAPAPPKPVPASDVPHDGVDLPSWVEPAPAPH
jgi:serine/threonine-protein kinase